ncbi:FAD-binding protein [Atopobiaceae bacterium 24-176]
MELVSCDVCVVGSGIAGLCAATAAAESGASVSLVCQGALCSGSSFAGTTWGLGMVGPRSGSEKDVQAFVDAVQEPGEHRASDAYVRALARGFHGALERFRAMGAVIEDVEPSHREDRAYVPCFGTVVQDWHGFHALQSVKPLKEKLCKAGIKVTDHCETLSLLLDPVSGAVSGILGFADGGASATLVAAGATVLATGGAAASLSPTLASPLAKGAGLVLACDRGAICSNLGYGQVMVGIFAKGRPAVFNEKVWALTALLKDGRDVFELVGVSPSAAREALEAHSWHGPYSRKRASRLVEESIAAVGGFCEAVVERPRGDVQPFIATYMDWLEKTHGFTWNDPMPVALFHQASNGGLRCNPDGWTRVPGLYAAGEVAPVFAVDRLGGIASSTAMVFGFEAGTSAAVWAKGRRSEGAQGAQGLLFQGPDGSLRPVASLQELSQGELAALRDVMGARVREKAHRLVRTAMDEAGSPF